MDLLPASLHPPVRVFAIVTKSSGLCRRTPTSAIGTTTTLIHDESKIVQYPFGGRQILCQVVIFVYFSFKHQITVRLI